MMNTNDITLERNVVKERSKVLYKVIKRTFDIVVSLVGCIFLLPIIIIVKISYIISKDYNSILYVALVVTLCQRTALRKNSRLASISLWFILV